MRLIAVILILLPISAFADSYQDACVDTAIKVSQDFGQEVTPNAKAQADLQCMSIRSRLPKSTFTASAKLNDVGCPIGVGVGMRNIKMADDAKSKILASIMETYCK